MPIIHLVKEHHSFGPNEVKVLATAFDAALLELGLGRTDPAALSVAKRIMALPSAVNSPSTVPAASLRGSV
jgi:hypothetical protein